mmetsp:Transcript_14753/g.20914  ORF Transcript_14753/g.20914 Transcript_14753/m.20914 type:complete len:541 (+) Transcript_14753:121-1743(+)
MTAANSITADEVSKSFPSDSRPTPLQTTLDLKKLLDIWQHLVGCASGVRSAFYSHGFLHLVCPAGYWSFFSNQQFPVNPTPIRPPPVPIYDEAATDNERLTITREHEILQKEYDTAMALNTALINELCLCLGPTNAKMVRDELRTNPSLPIMEVLDNLATEHPDTDEDRAQNFMRMNAPWNPSDGFNALKTQIEEAAMYASLSDHDIAEWQLVDAGLKLIKNTGLFAEEVKAWNLTPTTARSWADFKSFWKVQIKNVKACGGTSGVNLNFVNNTVAENPREYDEFESTVQNFSAASAAQSEVFADLTKQNTALAQSLAQNQQQQQQMQIQMMMMAQQMSMHQSGGGNGGGHGGGRRNNKKQNKGNGGNNTAGGYMMPMQQPFPMQCLPMQAQQMQMSGRAQANPVKRFENDNYCWTHGCDVQPGHTSMTCTNPAPGHNVYATRFNMMGGSMKGSHKTLKPSAVGKECASQRAQRRQQQQPMQQQMPQQMQQQPMANNMMGMGMQHMQMQQQQPMMMPVPMQQQQLQPMMMQVPMMMPQQH